MRTRERCAYSRQCPKYNNCKKYLYCETMEEMKQDVILEHDFLLSVVEKISPFDRTVILKTDRSQIYFFLKSFVVLSLLDKFKQVEVTRAVGYKSDTIAHILKKHAEKMEFDKYYRNYYKLFLKTKSEQSQVSKYPIDFAN